MKQAFITKNFRGESLEMIKRVNSILAEYAAQGFRLSLRQLYYQLVSRDVIPNNTRSYKNLGSLVSDARQAGFVDWDMIEDRNRETVIPPAWASPAHIIEAAARQFKIDLWEDQPWHVEVMVEKDALSGVLQPVCYELRIGLTANKGYSSSSTMYEIGRRIERKLRNGKSVLVLYLGDHDPSGIDMTRDVEDRLEMYAEHFLKVDTFDVQRLALNWDQIKKWNPPENPAKESDSRFAVYVERFGDSSWELDAVEPGELANLVREATQAVIDREIWDEAVQRESKMREALKGYADEYRSNNDEE